MMIERTEIGDAITYVSDSIVPISSMTILMDLYNGAAIKCAIRGCQRRASGVVQAKMLHRGENLCAGSSFLMPLCRTCHSLKNYHCYQHAWEIKEGYPLLSLSKFRE
ncbi:hypothetical protein [Entomospira culicis]|uniref:Uncharacterized protein n=1 Tax=Entomospira culicis TaxID=2719989 RepID=A0A968GKE1_9SPIO|nr:hypothetical protein [Entomospira culicis]NIZ19246.1 hypothetical protein [Entomospira culicis]NIZ69460.1 hypothetical protein [Entomospira culicis]WDI36576.1 hypothetical protein PVA46_04435 [Entomospira culicis]WDI38202.1 hypothetical protein PVA47_04435 [Entomospira culicis]